MAAQDSNKKTESTESKASSRSSHGSKSEAQAEKQTTGEAKETGNTLLQVLDFLKSSNLINLDVPLKSLFDQVQTIQPDPSSEWGLIGDSGHWALVWQKKHD